MGIFVCVVLYSVLLNSRKLDDNVSKEDIYRSFTTTKSIKCLWCETTIAHLPLKFTKAINDYLAWVAKCMDLDTTFCDVCQLLAVLEFKKIFTLNISIKR